MTDADPLPWTLLSLDVEASGGRSDTGSEHLRAVALDSLETALAEVGIAEARCEPLDTGDGEVLHLPADLPKTRLIRTVLPELSNLLRHHNREAAPQNVVRVRVSIHAGELRRDKRGLTGRAKVLLARLLNAKQVKDVLAAAPPSAAVVCVVSESFYRDVVEPGNIGVDPAAFTSITVREKETEADAWVTVVGHGAPDVPEHRPEPEPEPAPVQNAFHGINFTDNAQVHVHRGDLVQEKNVYGSDRPDS